MNLSQKTIADFGEQWQAYTFNDGYYGSRELLEDIYGPLLTASDIKNARIAEIGSGTGRIVNMLAESGARDIIAIEPSAAFSVLKQNTDTHASRITYLNIPGDALPAYGDVDMVMSIGVIHHIPNPDPVLRAAFDALKHSGKIFIWVYGAEGNRLYLSLFYVLSAITRHLPHKLLDAVCIALEWALSGYIAACRWLPLPMRRYMNHVVGKFDRRTRKLIIYDQLNPAYAKYYTRREVEDLLTRNGFVDIELYHRHHYSWSAVARKPALSIKTQ